ncbi:hypothetical protein Gpo141_00003446 [Globisporangium polare]
MASSLVDEEDSDDVQWQLLPNAAFDEIVASIMYVNPHAALVALKTPLIKRERDGSTLLHLFAGGENCDELIVFLLHAGIPVNVRDNSGWTPLLEAAQEGQIQNCEVLLAHGAIPDLAATSEDGMTPLHAAAKVGNAEMTKWLLKQPGAWPRQWDNAFFALLLQKTPAAALDYLDAFAQVQNHSKLGNVAVNYTNLRLIYGEPHVPVEQTALGLAVDSANGKQVLPHRVMRHLLKAKWRSFAKSMFRREFAVYCTLVASYYIPTIWADPNWVQLASGFDYWVACCRSVSWACSLYLLLNVEYNEFTGTGGSSHGANVKVYFNSFWNWLNFTSYAATMVTIPIEFIASLAEVRNCLLALVTVTLWVNMLQFLQVTRHSGLLLAMMSRMRKDVYRFCILYGVFLLGFSGAFYLLLRGSTGFESYRSAFITVLLMLFGNLDYDTFSVTQGWTWHMAHALLFTYLLSVVIVLLNILIAMMATTYSDIWDAAEAETMLCHAQAILRMEKSLSARDRELKYNKLLGRAAANSTEKPLDEPLPVTIQVERMGSTAMLRARFLEKKAMISSIVEKMKAMPKQAVENALATSPTWSAVKPIVASQAASFKAPNLDALKESLFLKSAFDADTAVDDLKDGAGNDDGVFSSHRRELGLLEDGIRYEALLKTSNEPKSQQELILELQAQLQQLTVYVKELGGNGGVSSSSSSGTAPRRRKSLVRYASLATPAEFV